MFQYIFDRVFDDFVVFVICIHKESLADFIFAENPILAIS
ncbi:hypothetical protein LEP1GSC203_0071 [Leptospira terpstrae serovar Hualin str. LT 11-33 = ATCC 700639]|uniref:Uncharacterized protein n=1 Tax=Leptospira terpstrae serovar Hualin str. LT 11-33 = ATCC 700639 TaxID=1257025 RepID=N1VJL5_9LEPT|nr:hypothetical protein LEP1GSC203_0071 [Leptospira terpstrae serovar Hualin str. LT 11-33 = ATCC 700639]